MILFSTTNVKHLAINMHMPQGRFILKKFSDGELYLRLQENVKKKNVGVLAALNSPPENILELYFLIDALSSENANITLFITYFGYTRQLTPLPGEARSGSLIASFFNRYSFKKIIILHPHTLLLRQFLDYTQTYDLSFFCSVATLYDAIAAPDEGAHSLAREIASTCNKELILFTKKRFDNEDVKILTMDGNCNQKNILIVDDIISTGKTIIEASKTLMEKGALSVSAAATHGIFAKESYIHLNNSKLSKIYVTNSLNVPSNEKITVFNLSSFILNAITEKQR